MQDLIFTTNLSQEEQQIIIDGLGEYAVEKANIDKNEVYIPFQFAYKDQEEHVKAGITGFCYYRCLYIGTLWIHSDYRKHKLGTDLINKAENFGKEQKCTFSTVVTMDWEAPEFYKKLGYEIEFIREGYVGNHRMFFLRKNLL